MGRCMIDSHCHTFYSKHATGTVDEIARAAISAGVTVLTITDHAPFIIDRKNRLLESELTHYFEDIELAQQRYSSQIKILRGLELDYTPGSSRFNIELLAKFPVDFVIGSIHYVEFSEKSLVKVWELPRLANKEFLNRYFSNLEELLECGLVDAIGHPDTLLRGVSEKILLPYFERFIELLSKTGIAFELNTSGLRKSSLDPITGREVEDLWSYPSREMLRQMASLDIPFTMGSDAHDPCDVGAGIPIMLQTLQPYGLQRISYYENRRRIDVSIDTFVF